VQAGQIEAMLFQSRHEAGQRALISIRQVTFFLHTPNGYIVTCIDKVGVREAAQDGKRKPR